MKALLLEQAGGVENMILKDIEKPTPKENEVLLEVKAISINPVDYKVRSIEDVITMIHGEQRPVIIGWDVSGIIVAKGEKVTKFDVGDNVFGMVNFPGNGNAYAEYVSSPEDHLARIPENIPFEEAAATTLAALTALQVFKGRIKKNDRVLIHAGAGGVGHFAIQIAKQLGAYVLATSSEKNKEFVLSLGADEHIDYRKQPFEEVVKDIDFVLDSMGGEVLENSLKVMKSGGTIVSLPTPASDEIQEEAKKLNVSVEFVLVQSNGEDMHKLKEMLKNRTLKAHVSKTFPFSDMGKAHTELETGRTVGKIVVKL